MIDVNTLVGRLMDLETKFYDLQERYHHLINEYEKLKVESEREVCKNGCDWCLLEATQESLQEHMARIKELEKEKHETDSSGHRNESCTRCDSCVCDKGR